MNAIETMSTADVEALADMEAFVHLLARGEKPTDPDLLGRIRERSDAASLASYAERGPLNVVVDLVREGRDED